MGESPLDDLLLEPSTENIFEIVALMAIFERSF